MMTDREIESRHQDDQAQNAKNSFFQYAHLFQEAPRYLVPFGNRITFFDPVRPEVVCNIENLHVGEAHCAHRVIGRLDVRTMAPGTTSAIKNDESVAR